MTQFHAYTTRFQSVRGDVRRQPGWARALIAAAALPGLLIGAAGLLVLALACAVLVLCIAPTLWLTRQVAGLAGPARPPRTPIRRGHPQKHVHSTVID